MTLLDRYLAKRLTTTTIQVLVALVLLVSIIDLVVTRQRDIVRYQTPPDAVLRYYLTFTPTILFEYQAAAVAVLIAGLMVLGRAAQDNEVTALLAGGVGLRRIARAPVVFAFCAAILTFLAQEYFGAPAAAVHEEIQAKYFSRVSDRSRVGVSWTNLSDGWTCHVLKYNLRANSGQDVFLHAIREERVEEIRARRIFWDETQRQWLLEDGRWAIFNPQRHWETTARRITQLPAPFTESPEALFALSTSAQSKTASQLAEDIAYARRLGIPIQEHLVNYHLKFSQPALCFVMIWLAIPFALRLRRGGVTLGFAVSICIALVYLLLFAISAGLGYMGQLPPAPAAWLANGVFMAAGLILFRLTPT